MRYYIDSQNLPNKIMIREELEDQQAIEQWLSKEAGRKVEIKSKFPKIFRIKK